MSAHRGRITAHEAAGRLGLTSSHVRYLAKNGRIPRALKAGCCGKWLVPVGWVETYQRQRQLKERAAHGTRSSYVAGCRCPACTAAHSSYEHARRLRRGQVVPSADPPPGFISMTEACARRGCGRATLEYHALRGRLPSWSSRPGAPRYVLPADVDALGPVNVTLRGGAG